MTLTHSAPGERQVNTNHRMTFEEFLFLTPEGLKSELHNGEMRIMSPASVQHEALQGFLLAVVREYVLAHNLGVVLGSRFITRMSHIRGYEPDVLFVRRERLVNVTDTYLEGAPDVAIEIISPDSRSYDLEEKLKVYEEGGVEEYWAIDPYLREAHFFRRRHGKLQPVRVRGEFVSQVIDGFRLRLEWLWSAPDKFPTAAEVLKYIEKRET